MLRDLWAARYLWLAIAWMAFWGWQRVQGFDVPWYVILLPVWTTTLLAAAIAVLFYLMIPWRDDP